MDTQRHTFALSRNLLAQAKALAAQRGISLSAIIRQALEEFVSREDYAAARQRQMDILNSGLDLGTQGHIAWKRGSLYER